MSAVENIFGMVILVAIFLVAAFILTSDQLSKNLDVLSSETEVFYQNKYETDLNTLLLTTEPISGRPIGILLGDSLYYRKSVYNFGNYSVNISKYIEAILDYTYGRGAYYFVLQNPISDIRLYFIIDGSSTMTSKQAKLVDALPKLVNKLSENYTVEAKVYILLNNFSCEGFLTAGIPCEYITREVLYPNGFKKSWEDLEVGLNFTSNISSEWAIKAGIIEPEGYFIPYEDWGSATALVAMMEEMDAPSRITILFPISDELSGGSEPSDCDKATAVGPTGTIYRDEAIIKCGFCNMSCPTSTSANRSQTTIDNAVRIAQEKRFHISPILGDMCQFYVGTPGSQLYKDYNLACWQIAENGTPQSNACCGGTDCTGCPMSPGGSSGMACIHPECKGELESQMANMAKGTSGTFILLDEIDKFEAYLNKTINETVRGFSIILGEVKNVTRYAYERELMLPNQFSVNITLWVYPEEKNVTRPILNDTVFGRPEPAIPSPV